MSTQGYIMLSYQWGHQEVVLKIRDRLRKEGYRLWIDVENMEGFIFTAMSNAVKEADLVLACLSKKYEQSKNCKKEGGCITEFNTPFIPLKMEDYKLDDWVAGIFGGYLYVDFSNVAKFDENIEELLRRLQKHPSLKPQVPNPNPPIPPSEPLPSPANSDIPHPSTDTSTGKPVKPDWKSGLSEEVFYQLFEDVSSWWEQHGNVNMLKVLLSDFPDNITVDDLEEKNEAIDLLALLKGGLISTSDIKVLVEVTILGGLHGLEPMFKERLPTFPGFDKVEIERFSVFRRKLVKFGKIISKNNKARIGHLNGLKVQQGKDQWFLIFELEKKYKLTEENRPSFIKKLKDNGMHREAAALA